MQHEKMKNAHEIVPCFCPTSIVNVECCTISDHKIDEFFLDVDDLCRWFALQPLLHLLTGQSLDLFPGRRPIEFDLSAEFAVHLNGDGQAVADHQSRIERRPGLMCAGLPEPLPQFFAQVRRERRKQQDKGLKKGAGRRSSFVISLVNTIICEMAVLNRNASISSVTFLMV